jgi:hypothetical protein
VLQSFLLVFNERKTKKEIIGSSKGNQVLLKQSLSSYTKRTHVDVKRQFKIGVE